MATRPPELDRRRALDGSAGKRAFALAAAALAAAAGVIVTLGPSGGSGGPPPSAPPARGRVLAPPSEEREPEPGLDLRAARAAAARFSVAFLARESGRMGAATRRALQTTASSTVWPLLRAPVRTTPAWQPAAASFERVAGLSETGSPGVVEATVAFRREGRRHYLSLWLVREEGRWRAAPRGM